MIDVEEMTAEQAERRLAMVGCRRALVAAPGVVGVRTFRDPGEDVG